MASDKEFAFSLLEDFVRSTLKTWFERKVEFVALSNRIPVETFAEGDPPCRVQSARLRGLEVLHLIDDMTALADALVHTFGHICADAMADVEANRFAVLPLARGMA
jgi:hypothetical protein